MGSSSQEAAEYEADFKLSDDFGEVGPIMVENEHHTEMFINKIVLDGFQSAPLIFPCESWVSPKENRIFFSAKSYLPSETPNGLKKYREKELELLRGDGTGEWKKSDRIYDYDVYNDLGDPDRSEDMARPVLGGTKTYPYPRRCRTGRPKTKKDPLFESRSSTVYVLRDEMLSTVKNLQFSTNTVYSVLRAIAPSIEGAIQDRDLGFPFFTAIDSLFNEGIHIPDVDKSFLDIFPMIIKAVEDTGNTILRFDTREFVDSKYYIFPPSFN